MSTLRKLTAVVVLTTTLFVVMFGASFLTMKLAFDREDRPQPLGASERCVG